MSGSTGEEEEGEATGRRETADGVRGAERGVEETGGAEREEEEAFGCCVLLSGAGVRVCATAATLERGAGACAEAEEGHEREADELRAEERLGTAEEEKEEMK